MKIFALLLFGLSLAACSVGCGQHPSHYTASGTVRNVWCHQGLAFNWCDVVFEHDSGPLQTLSFLDTSVPVWTGLHAKLVYHSAVDGNGDLDILDYVLRTP
jgi:hypothetical protein